MKPHVIRSAAGTRWLVWWDETATEFDFVEDVAARISRCYRWVSDGGFHPAYNPYDDCVVALVRASRERRGCEVSAGVWNLLRKANLLSMGAAFGYVEVMPDVAFVIDHIARVERLPYDFRSYSLDFPAGIPAPWDRSRVAGRRASDDVDRDVEAEKIRTVAAARIAPWRDAVAHARDLIRECEEKIK